MTDQEIKDLQDKAAALEAENKGLKSSNAELKKVITEIEKGKAAAPVATAGTGPATFTLKGKKYRIIFPAFYHRGTRYTAAQAAKDPALQQELIDMGFGGLQEEL